MNNNYYITPEEIDIAVEGLLNKIGLKLNEKYETKMKKKYGDKFKTSAEKAELAKKVEALNKDVDETFKPALLKNKSKIQAIVNNALKKASFPSSLTPYIKVLDNEAIEDAIVSEKYIDSGASALILDINLYAWEKDSPEQDDEKLDEMNEAALDKIEDVLAIIETKEKEFQKILGIPIELYCDSQSDYGVVYIEYHPKVREED